MLDSLSLDPGYGNVKIYGAKGSLVLQSAVAVAGRATTRRMSGLRTTRPPMCVETGAGGFYVGGAAHDWGRPVENLDFDRLAGSPEMLALFLGAMAQYGVASEPVNLVVGLPIASLMGDGAGANSRAVRRFLTGTHMWRADGVEHTLTVDSVRLTSQPVGAMFDFLLADDGAMPPGRRAGFEAEIGVVGIGLNTVELLVVRHGSPVQRFTAGQTLGVRRLLELIDRFGHFSLAELDTQLRRGALDVTRALPVWESDVLGFVEKRWGTSFRRFYALVVVGGGAKLLREPLLRRFKDRAYIPDDPIIATARGLYKFTLTKRGGR